MEHNTEKEDLDGNWRNCFGGACYRRRFPQREIGQGAAATEAVIFQPTGKHGGALGIRGWEPVAFDLHTGRAGRLTPLPNPDGS